MTLLRGLDTWRNKVGGRGSAPSSLDTVGWPRHRMFTDSDKVQVGDTFTFEVFGEVLTYRAFDKKVVNPRPCAPNSGRDLATSDVPPWASPTHCILLYR